MKCRGARLFVPLALAWTCGAAATAVQVTDDTGRRVGLAQPAARILTLSPHGTELVFAAGAGDKLAGAAIRSDYPPAARQVPRVGGAARLDRESVIRLAPDLIVAWPSGNRPADLKWIQDQGIVVYQSEPASLDAIADNLRDIGRLAGTEATADAAAAAFEARLVRLGKRRGETSPIRVFYQIWPHPLITIGRPHLINKVLALCGAESIFPELRSPAPAVLKEAVIRAAPQAIIAAVETDAKDDPFAVWREWTQIPAVADDRLIRIPADLIHRASPRILDGAELLCRALRSKP